MADHDFDFRKLSSEEAERRRRELGARTGGRRSKYSPVGEQVQNLKEGEVLAFTTAPNQLISLRNYMTRNFGEQYRVSSRRVSDEQFEVHVAHSTGDAPKRRGRKKKEA